MKVEQQKITKLVISDVENHDPIHVYLEDEGDNRRGRVTVSEFGKSWSCSWAGMGMPLIEFLQWVTNQYWIGYLDSGMYKTIDADNENNILFIKKQIVKSRKNKNISTDDARDMFDDTEYSDDIKRDILNCTYSKYRGLLGDDPWLAQWPTQDNHEYSRMESRLNTVREAIKLIQEQA